MDKSHPIVISLGGSLVVPQAGIDFEFLGNFNIFLREKISQGFRFIVVVGGGTTARNYIAAAQKIKKNISGDDLDWIGIKATHLNAYLVKTIFQHIAYPKVLTDYSEKISNLKESLVVAGGWEPGCSTDYDAVYLAREYGGKVILNMSNIPQAFDDDPKINKNAKPIDSINWDDFSRIVGAHWSPGKNTPFDPPATKLAKEIGLTVYIIGKDLDNLDDIFCSKPYIGTIITP